MGAPGRPEPSDVLVPPLARRILDAIEAIPAGRVMTYGDVAEYVQAGSGRVVGNVLSRYGHEVPWWRVLLASGRPAPGHATEQLELLVAEGVPVHIGTGRVDLARARWDGRTR